MGELSMSIRRRYEDLREEYTANPQAATIHKRARSLPADGSDPYHCEVIPENLNRPEAPYGVTWNIGIDRAVGGLHDAPNPGEVLCGALAACFDGTIRMLAGLLGVQLREVSVTASADVDVRGALALAPQVRVGLDAMRLEARLRTGPNTPEPLTRALVEAAERYCITLDTLRSGVPVTLSIDAPPGDENGQPTSQAFAPRPVQGP